MHKMRENMYCAKVSTFTVLNTLSSDKASGCQGVAGATSEGVPPAFTPCVGVIRHCFTDNYQSLCLISVRSPQGQRTWGKFTQFYSYITCLCSDINVIVRNRDKRLCA